MSWSVFKKAFSGRRSKMEDLEFEQQVNQLNQAQALCKRVYKDMRKCCDAETAQVKAQQKMLVGLRSCPLTRSEPLKHTVEVFSAVMAELQSSCKLFKSEIDASFTDPMRRFYNVYRHLDFHCKQRETKLQEYEKQQSRLDKLERKMNQQGQGASQTKLDLAQRAVTSARLDYERVHERLMQELPQLYQSRVGYFDACLKGTIRHEALYYKQNLKILHLQFREEVQSSEDCEAFTEKQLEDIRTLSIVGSSTLSA